MRRPLALHTTTSAKLLQDCCALYVWTGTSSWEGGFTIPLPLHDGSNYSIKLRFTNNFDHENINIAASHFLLQAPIVSQLGKMILNNEIFDNCLSAFCRKLLFIWILKNHHFNEPFNKYFTENDDQSKDYNCSLSQAVDRAAFQIGFFGWESLTDQKL